MTRGVTTCCPKGTTTGCRDCRGAEVKRLNETTLKWSARMWLPLWARLDFPQEFARAGPGWRCGHPACTWRGKDQGFV
jgi:hypothetical protein